MVNGILCCLLVGHFKACDILTHKEEPHTALWGSYVVPGPCPGELQRVASMSRSTPRHLLKPMSASLPMWRARVRARILAVGLHHHCR